MIAIFTIFDHPIPLQIVELLIDKTDPRRLYEAVLLAITLDHDDITLLIIKHPIWEKMEKRGDILEVNKIHSVRVDGVC